MAFFSMTGFGRGTATIRGLRVEVELSSVNRKQLDILVNLPRYLAVLESRVHEKVHHALSRGRINVDFTVQRSSSSRAEAIRVDEELARVFVTDLKKAAARLGLKDDLGSSILLNLPDVVRYEQNGASAAACWPVLEKALDLALSDLVKMRAKEGVALQKDLRKRLACLKKTIGAIRTHAPGVISLYRKNLLSRLQQAGLAIEHPDERLLRELALFADRSDITEELTRLGSHLQQADDMMKSKEAVGRSFDFLVQEMFREINTVGSKANDGAILRQVVEFKAELERIKEQVQNIE
ncbi:MAG TPA: YicC family protein [Verrucomicrobia bacterium]|nr:MAG: YicC family protein [Lentisphaerae bacterium GWF2_57_35]HBA86252.1 YicC family protein [Verrucomicrobiota bacterium]